MSACQEQSTTSTIHGSLLRLRGGRAMAIYLRNGVVSVADLSGQRGRILSVGEWTVFHARKLAFAQRRGEVEILSPITEDAVARIERLHRALELPDHPLRRKAVGLLAEIPGVFLRLARALLDSTAAGRRVTSAGAFHVD